MDALDDRLREWADAGLITPTQLATIRAHEAEREHPPAEDAGTGRRHVVAEAVGYVGAALAIGAVALLLREVWPDLLPAGRLALVATLTVLLLGAGAALHRAASGALQRLCSTLLAGGVIGVGWSVAVLAGEMLAWRDARVGLAAGAAAAVVALPLHALRRRALSQAALLGALIVAVVAALSLPRLALPSVWFGASLAALGVAWALLGAGGWLPPRRLAETLGAVLAVLALQGGSFDARLVMLSAGVALAAGLVVVAVLGDRLHHLVVGALALFVFVPQLVLELFGDAIDAPAALLVVGLLLVLLAVGLGRVRREVGRGGDGAAA